MTQMCVIFNVESMFSENNSLVLYKIDYKTGTSTVVEMTEQSWSPFA